MCDHYPDLIPVNLTQENLSEKIMDETGGWGVDRFFECSGAVKAYESIFTCCSPGAHVVLIGNNAEPVPMNWAILFAKGLEYQTVHRYSHQYEPSIRLLGSGKIDVKPMITHTFNFEENFDDLLEKNYIKKGRGSGIVKAGDNYLADTTLDLLYELRK